MIFITRVRAVKAVAACSCMHDFRLCTLICSTNNIDMTQILCLYCYTLASREETKFTCSLTENRYLVLAQCTYVVLDEVSPFTCTYYVMFKLSLLG